GPGLGRALPDPSPEGRTHDHLRRRQAGARHPGGRGPGRRLPPDRAADRGSLRPGLQRRRRPGQYGEPAAGAGHHRTAHRPRAGGAIRRLAPGRPALLLLRHPQAAAGRRLAAAGRRRRRHSPAARLAAEFLRRRSAASRSAAGLVMVAGAMRIFMSADTVGGVWNYTLELARGLIEAGDEVVAAAMGGRLSADQRQAVAAIPGLTVHDSALRLEWMASPWTDLERAAGWLLALADTVEPDVVHLNHYAH